MLFEARGVVTRAEENQREINYALPIYRNRGEEVRKIPPQSAPETSTNPLLLHGWRNV